MIKYLIFRGATVGQQLLRLKLKDPSKRQLIAIGKIAQYYEKECFNFLYFTLKITKPIPTKYIEVKQWRGI